MKIICDCGEEMKLTTLEPDCIENYVGFDCPECSASLYGTHRFGQDDESENNNEGEE